MVTLAFSVAAPVMPMPGFRDMRRVLPETLTSRRSTMFSFTVTETLYESDRVISTSNALPAATAVKLLKS